MYCPRLRLHFTRNNSNTNTSHANVQKQTRSRAGITHIGGSSVMSLQPSPDGLIRVELAVSAADSGGKDCVRMEDVHEVITCCGYRPDMSIVEELQVCGFA